MSGEIYRSVALSMQDVAKAKHGGGKVGPNPASTLPAVSLTPPLQYVHMPPHLPSHSYRWDAGNVREVLEKKRAAGRMPVNIAEEKVSV